MGDASDELLWSGEGEAHGVGVVTEVGAVVVWFGARDLEGEVE